VVHTSTLKTAEPTMVPKPTSDLESRTPITYHVVHGWCELQREGVRSPIGANVKRWVESALGVSEPRGRVLRW
jgi:hypothetical protein